MSVLRALQDSFRYRCLRRPLNDDPLPSLSLTGRGIQISAMEIRAMEKGHAMLRVPGHFGLEQCQRIDWRGCGSLEDQRRHRKEELVAPMLLACRRQRLKVGIVN